MNDLSRRATRLEAIEGSYDKWLLGAIIALTGVGVVMVASSSIALMSSPFYYLNRHLIFRRWVSCWRSSPPAPS